MDKFDSHTGVVVPLRRSNVDTDQIIPAVYLKRVTRTGFEDGLFAAWRNDPEFVLNNPAYTSGSVLVAGPDFGTGSSREHAVWALQNYGFKVVIGSRFGDIFRSNSGKAGLVIATVGQDVVEKLWEIAESEPGIECTVDLHHRTVEAADNVFGFEIDDYTRWRLMEGLDDIGLTMQKADDIAAYEAKAATARGRRRVRTMSASMLPPAPVRAASMASLETGSAPAIRAQAKAARAAATRPAMTSQARRWPRQRTAPAAAAEAAGITSLGGEVPARV